MHVLVYPHSRAGVRWRDHAAQLDLPRQEKMRGSQYCPGPSGGGATQNVYWEVGRRLEGDGAVPGNRALTLVDDTR